MQIINISQLLQDLFRLSLRRTSLKRLVVSEGPGQQSTDHLHNLFDQHKHLQVQVNLHLDYGAVFGSNISGKSLQIFSIIHQDGRFC